MIVHWPILVGWGMAAATFSTVIYRRLAPQGRIDTVRTESNQARSEMLAYDGDFDGLMLLVRRSLRLSMTQLGLSFGPAIGASLPAMLIFFYLDRTASPSTSGLWGNWEVWFFLSATIFSIVCRLMLRPRAEIANA